MPEYPGVLMKMKRTITIEFDHTTVTTAHDQQKLRWCAVCQAESEFITHAEAVHLAKFIAELGIAIRKEDMHFYQTGDEPALICLNSILNGNYPKSNNH